MELSDPHIAILSGITFFLVVGRLLYDSFRELFTDLLILAIPNVMLMMFEEMDCDHERFKVFLIVVGSVLCGVYVYYKFLT